jgi:hypothetical protein
MKASQFLRLPRHEQTRVYFTHPNNQVTAKNGSRGISMRAQADFHNDWLAALHNFADSL